MTGNGITQIVLYAVVLTLLAYPLGIYMARVYTGTLPRAALAGGARARLLPARRHRRRARAGLEGVREDGARLHGRLRGAALPAAAAQDTLPLNPDGLPGVLPHIAMNTTASFVTNTNWQYYGGEFTMSYLSQMAGLAVQNFVSAALGMAVLVAVVRGFARRIARRRSATSGSTSTARSSTSCCRSRSSSRCCSSRRASSQTFDGAATATTVEGGAAGDRARPGRVADRDQAARHERRRLLQLELGRPVREPERLHELPRDALDPAHPGRAGVHVRADGRRAPAGAADLRARCSRCSRSASRSRCRRSSTARRCCATRA